MPTEGTHDVGERLLATLPASRTASLVRLCSTPSRDASAQLDRQLRDMGFQKLGQRLAVAVALRIRSPAVCLEGSRAARNNRGPAASSHMTLNFFCPTQPRFPALSYLEQASTILNPTYMF